jgi:hypothetical protein
MRNLVDEAVLYSVSRWVGPFGCLPFKYHVLRRRIQADMSCPSLLAIVSFSGRWKEILDEPVGGQCSDVCSLVN